MGNLNVFVFEWEGMSRIYGIFLTNSKFRILKIRIFYLVDPII